MTTKFESFLKDKKIDPRRVIAASSKLEKLRPEDRSIRLDKRRARKSEDGGKKKEGEAPKKPRTGRPVTDRAVAAALIGKPLSGPQKTRILRAINHLLEQKKQGLIDLTALFDMPSQGNPPKKAKKAAEG